MTTSWATCSTVALLRIVADLIAVVAILHTSHQLRTWIVSDH
jgi:hypothetical protein